MKTIIPPTNNTGAGALLLFLLFCAGICQAQTSPSTGTNQADSSGYVCIQRGPNSKVWQRTFVSTDAAGNVTTNEQSYTELATGICHLSNGQYVDSVEEVESVPGGAQAVQGRHQVQWALNANTPRGAVTVLTPDGKQLSSTVFGLAYYDVGSGSNVAIAQLKNCDGAIVAPNQVIYANAFSNITADVLYTYTKAGVSQDIVLDSAPPAPHTYGLSDESTVLEVWTEFFNPPTPEITAVTNGNVTDCQVLDFGDMKMAVGQAFFLNVQNTSVSAGMVQKQWIQATNGIFLVEAIGYASISNQLQQLPQASNLKPNRASIRRLAFQDPNRAPPNRPAKATKPMKLAKLETSKPRLKVDYELLSSSSSLTLQGDTTYFVSGLVNITGTTTIEGGTVVKYTNSSSAQIASVNFDCATALYSPGVLTSMNDDSVGATIDGSTGSPSQNAATYLSMASVEYSSPVFSNLRFSYADQAIYIGELLYGGGGYTNTIQDCQFIYCGTVFLAGLDYPDTQTFPLALFNVLLSQCGYGFIASNYFYSYSIMPITAENVTADQIGEFVGAYTSGTATNCIFTAVTAMTLTASDCATYSSSNNVFQIVGAGSYYLANGSTNRGAGTASIPAALLADLQTLTTYPPMVTNGWITNDYTFSQQVERNTGVPDLGYHYPPIDWALNIEVSNATITVAPGTALAAYGTGSGVDLDATATFTCEGTATSPNYLLRYNAVQEQSSTNWESADWGELMYAPASPDGSLANFVFTVWSGLAGDALYYSFVKDCPLWLQNCQLYNGTITMGGTEFLSTNCLYRRAYLNLYNHTVGEVPSTNELFNNLFWRGAITSEGHSSPSIWIFQDNLFDECTNTVSTIATDICSNNAYVTTNFGTLGYGSNNVVLSNSPAYQTGALGDYYYPTTFSPTNLTLIHTGSRLASAAGLYHYTVLTNADSIEGTNIVSIGFHYVGVGANGLPLDTNGDGIPDYLEDANGNGVVDSGEIDWQVAGDLGLTVIITQPANNTTIP